MAGKGSKKNSIPDRWEEYLSMGKRLPKTRFITFKVPLKKILCDKLEKAEEFSPESLLQMRDDESWSLGLVIDLTNTTRYYDPQDFITQDVEYQKIFTEGHIVPSQNVIKRFTTVVDDFLERHQGQDKLIGVHCTHGVNRTGYLVCRYMIDKLAFEPDEAIQAYKEARGYPIERENYLADLRSGRKIDSAAYEEYKLTNPVKPYDPRDQYIQRYPSHVNNRNGYGSHSNEYFETNSAYSNGFDQSESIPTNRYANGYRRNDSEIDFTSNRYSYNFEDRRRDSHDFHTTQVRRNQHYEAPNKYGSKRYQSENNLHPSTSNTNTNYNDGYNLRSGHSRNQHTSYGNHHGIDDYGQVGSRHSNSGYGSYGHQRTNNDYGSYGRRHPEVSQFGESSRNISDFSPKMSNTKIPSRTRPY